jgi:hypothetical protein
LVRGVPAAWSFETAVPAGSSSETGDADGLVSRFVRAAIAQQSGVAEPFAPKEVPGPKDVERLKGVGPKDVERLERAAGPRRRLLRQVLRRRLRPRDSETGRSAGQPCADLPLIFVKIFFG